MLDLNTILDVAKDKETIKKFLTEKARQDLMEWINVKVLPTVKDAIEEFNKELREQAKGESGWCKIRDAFFIPTVLTVVVWFFTQMGEIINKETSKQSN